MLYSFIAKLEPWVINYCSPKVSWIKQHQSCAREGWTHTWTENESEQQPSPLPAASSQTGGKTLLWPSAAVLLLRATWKPSLSISYIDNYRFSQKAKDNCYLDKKNQNINENRLSLQREVVWYILNVSVGNMRVVHILSVNFRDSSTVSQARRRALPLPSEE